MSQRVRQIVTVLLALFGVEFWLTAFIGDWGRNVQVEIMLAAFALPLIPGIAPAAWFVLKRLHRPSPLALNITTILVSIGGGVVLSYYAIATHRDLFPHLHDEFQFLLQTRMLSEGRLWMPGHPLYDFFDTFYVLIQPKYAAQSFPGTAILFVPSIWLHVAPWKWAILLSAIAIGVFYRVVAEIAGGLPGLLCAMMLSKLSIFQYASTMILAQNPVTLLGLATIWMYLRWRKHHTAWSAAWLGFIAGFAFITRPADALIFMIPVGLAMLLDLRRSRAFSLRAFVPSCLRALLLPGFLGALPWIALMLIFDRGVTGHWLITPFDFYNQRDQPGLHYTLFANQPGDPITKLPEKRGYFLGGVAYRIMYHRPDLLWNAFANERFPTAIQNCIPQPLLGALIPLGLFFCLRRRVWVLAVGLPMFFILYTPYPIFIQHYVIVAAPAEIFCAALGISAIARAWPRARSRIWTAAFIFVIGLMFTRASEAMQMVNALAFHNGLLQSANDRQAELTAKGQPAVILFHRTPNIIADFEPVYNTATAWPEDATVIRAHDLGNQNWEIFQYYATHGPDRAFYWFDENNPGKPLVYLGMASELAKYKSGQDVPNSKLGGSTRGSSPNTDAPG
jgi:hypothetical protein